MLGMLDLAGDFWTSLGPWMAAGLTALAVALGWMAFRPSPSAQTADERLDAYLRGGGDVVQEEIMRQSFFRRAVLPLLRGLLRFPAGTSPTSSGCWCRPASRWASA